MGWLRLVLLLPVAPLLGWGPFTHVYTARLAWKKVQDNPGVAANDLPERLNGQEEAFWRAAVSADAISTYHVLRGCALYDYMHNWIPDRADGVPRFGYALIAQCMGSCPSPYDLAVSCGWLAHQLADWWAHYAPIGPDGLPVGTDKGATASPVFAGYANSFRVIGADFYPEVLAHYRVLDHSLTETLYDLLVVFRPDAAALRGYAPALFQPLIQNPLTLTSERWAGTLPRVPPDLVWGIQVEFTRVMRGLIVLYSLLRPFRPVLMEKVDHLLDFTKASESYLERCADKIVQGLFGVPLEQMAEWATVAGRPSPGGLPFAVRELPAPPNPYPGSPLFEAASMVGNIREEIDTSLLPALADLLEVQYPPSETGLSLRLLASLALNEDEESTLRHLFYQRMPPVITLPGVPPEETADHLAAALEKKEFDLAFVPATRLEGGADPPGHGPKSLDPQSIRVTFNGYEMDRYPAYFRVEKSTQEGRIIWHCRLLRTPREGFHYLWAEARDRSGTPARPFRYQIHLSG